MKRAPPTLALSLVLLAIGTLCVATQARARRAAPILALAPLRPLPRALSPDAALLVTARAAPRRGNLRPAGVRLTGPDGAAERVRIVELAPELFRLGPIGRLAPGAHRVSGLAGVRIIRVSGHAGAAPASPVIDRITREGDALAQRVVVTLQSAPPSDTVALFARWDDWHDDEGGLYGAWTSIAPSEGTRVTLICVAEAHCRDVHGHLPRERERGLFSYVDAEGRVSAATTFVAP